MSTIIYSPNYDISRTAYASTIKNLVSFSTLARNKRMKATIVTVALHSRDSVQLYIDGNSVGLPIDKVGSMIYQRFEENIARRLLEELRELREQYILALNLSEGDRITTRQGSIFEVAEVHTGTALCDFTQSERMYKLKRGNVLTDFSTVKGVINLIKHA